MTAIVGYKLPDSPTWAIAGGDAAFDTDPAALNNGRVTDRTAIKWPSGAQTTSTSIKLQMTWSVAQPVRVIPILGLKGIPAGTKIIVTGYRAGTDTVGTFPYALGGNSATQRTFAFANGDVGAWIVVPASNDDLNGIQVEIKNDVNGVASIAADSFVYVGEIDPFEAFESMLKKEWQPHSEGLPADIRAVNNQPWRFSKPQFRVHPFVLSMTDFVGAYGTAGLPLAMDYDKLANVTATGNQICFVPEWQDVNGTLDTWNVHRNSIFGVARNVGLPQFVADSQQYDLTMSIAEAPGV